MSIEDVLTHIDSSADQDLAKWAELVAQPSISAQDVGVRECAEILMNIMEQSGITSQLYETQGNPVVYGEVLSDLSDAFTILFYGHYDVQPPEPYDEWISPPFEPTLREGRLYGRGTADNKGQLLAHVFAVRSYLHTHGSVPINVKFIFDGEEESGSPSLRPFVEANRDLLAADLVYTSDGPMNEDGTPVVFFGVRGSLSIEVELETGRHDNHSGNKGGLIPNAAWEMVNLLSSMRDRDGNITIEGFGDDVRKPTDTEMRLIRDLPYDQVNTAKVFGVDNIILDKEDFYLNLMFRPTLTINGLESGYTGLGTKSVIPCKARAKIDVRLVPDQDPDTIFNVIEKYIAANQTEASIVRLKSEKGVPPSRTPTDLPSAQAVIRTVGLSYDSKPMVMSSLGATLPDFIWTDLLDTPSIMVPYANADETNHAPNENMTLECFYAGIRTSARVIQELGRLGGKAGD